MPAASIALPVGDVKRAAVPVPSIVPAPPMFPATSAIPGWGVTVSATAALVTLPAAFETTTLNCAPLSDSIVVESV